MIIKKEMNSVIILLVIIILGLCIIYIRQNNTCVEKLTQTYNGKNVGDRANNLASSFQHYQASTAQKKLNTFNKFNIEMSDDPYVSWCRLRSHLGGCEDLDAAGYSARGGSCKPECAALGQSGG
tara:strand:+ start:600 stop:971 length:372 start_codon:yes stop_codon:yes gene_type:complete